MDSFLKIEHRKIRGKGKNLRKKINVYSDQSSMPQQHFLSDFRVLYQYSSPNTLDLCHV